MSHGFHVAGDIHTVNSTPDQPHVALEFCLSVLVISPVETNVWAGVNISDKEPGCGFQNLYICSHLHARFHNSQGRDSPWCAHVHTERVLEGFAVKKMIFVSCR